MPSSHGYQGVKQDLALPCVAPLLSEGSAFLLANGRGPHYVSIPGGLSKTLLTPKAKIPCRCGGGGGEILEGYSEKI